MPVPYSYKPRTDSRHADNKVCNGGLAAALLMMMGKAESDTIFGVILSHSFLSTRGRIKRSRVAMLSPSCCSGRYMKL